MSRPITTWALVGLAFAAFVLAGRREPNSCQLPSCSLAWAVENPASPQESSHAEAAGGSADAAASPPSQVSSSSEATSAGGQPESPPAEKSQAEGPPASPGESQAQQKISPAPSPTEPTSPPTQQNSPATASPAETTPSTPPDQPQPVPHVPPEQPTESKPNPEDQPSVERPIPNLAEIIAKLRQQEPGKYRPVGEVCQVKTYRVETLHGFGFVVDLTELARSLGTSGRMGQSAVGSLGTALKPPTSLPTTEALRRVESLSSADLKAALALLDRTADEDLLQAIPESLWERRAVTLVSVTVSVPPEGAHQGDRLDCQLRSFEPKSLSGGFLLPTKLYPPGPRDKAPAGIAAGPVLTESSLRATGDRVVGGCLVQQDIREEFVREGKIRLLLKPEHANFLVAQDIADRINVEVGLFAGKPIARALSSSVIEVEVPPGFEDNPVGFVTQLLRLPSSVPVEQPSATPFRSLVPERRP
jgi:hypothetical protein